MRALSAAELLRRLGARPRAAPVERALRAAGRRLPGRAPDELLARSPIGQRDARLLALRERTFGPRLDCQVALPGLRRAARARARRRRDLRRLGRAADDGAATRIEVQPADGACASACRQRRDLVDGDRRRRLTAARRDGGCVERCLIADGADRAGRRPCCRRRSRRCWSREMARRRPAGRRRARARLPGVRPRVDGAVRHRRRSSGARLDAWAQRAAARGARARAAAYGWTRAGHPGARAPGAGGLPGAGWRMSDYLTPAVESHR